MSNLLEGLSQTWLTIQGTLFPWLNEELGELTEKQQDLDESLYALAVMG
ncbi:MAG: hypothetical protein KAG28_07905 [Cocleimonas sp.]|nr:hypothetical protein [Cocleimonas sp.]